MQNQNNIDMVIEKRAEIKKQIKEKFIEWSSSSTSHGYPNIFKTKYRLLKVIWTFFLLAAVGCCLFFLTRSINSYLEFGVITNIEMVDERPVIFPTITICDLEKFQTDFAADLIKEIYLTQLKLDVTDIIDNSNVAAMYANVYKLATARAASPSFGDSNRKNLTNDFRQNLFWCGYNNNFTDCDVGDFLWSYDYTYGNCYKFNSGLNADSKQVPLRNASKPGDTNGLNFLLFNIENPNKYSRFNIKKHEGIVMFIHDTTHNPITSDGIQVPPGANVNIAIKKKITHKYPYPYSNCKDLSSFSSDFYDIITQSNKSYRQSDCFNLLLQRNIIKNCSCYDLQYYRLYNATPCLNNTQLDCAEMNYMSFWNNDLDSYSSECPLECDFVEYDFTFSTSDFDAYGLYMYKYNTKPPFVYQLNIFKKQLVSINVYFSDLRYTEITETPSMTIIDLFANIGGTVGLFVGISVLSFVEIIEIIIEVIIIYFEKRKEARQYKIQS